MKIEFHQRDLSAAEQAILARGFDAHARQQQAPEYSKQRFVWRANDVNGKPLGILTADLLWDWLYIDELWVDAALRGTGLGRQLMLAAEDSARDEGLQGLWLWTQSWQAEGFYTRLGYREFTRFENFPKGHSRIGLRKALA